MAKKKHNLVPDHIQITDDGKPLEIYLGEETEKEDTGIFQTDYRNFVDSHGNSLIAGSAKEIAKVLFIREMPTEFNGAYEDFAKWINNHVKQVQEILSFNSEESKERVQDACAARFFYDEICDSVEKGRFFAAMCLCIELGYVLQRLPVRQFEKNVIAYKNSKEGAKKAAKRHSEKAAKKRPDFQKLVEAEMKRLQKLKGHNRVYQEACRNVGEAKGYDARTVMNHVPNTWTPKKRNMK